MRLLATALVALAFPASAIGAPRIDHARVIRQPSVGHARAIRRPSLGPARQVSHLPGHVAHVGWLLWPRPKVTPTIYRALWAARQFWGREPAHCREVWVYVLGEAKLPWPILGQATIPPKHWRIELCTLYLREEFNDPANWTKACTVTTHEFGHLLGYEHSPDANNIMFPLYLPSIVPDICKGG